MSSNAQEFKKDTEFELMLKEAMAQYRGMPEFLVRIALQNALIDERTPKRKGKITTLLDDDPNKPIPDYMKTTITDTEIKGYVEITNPEDENNSNTIVEEITPITNEPRGDHQQNDENVPTIGTISIDGE